MLFSLEKVIKDAAGSGSHLKIIRATKIGKRFDNAKIGTYGIENIYCRIDSLLFLWMLRRGIGDEDKIRIPDTKFYFGGTQGCRDNEFFFDQNQKKIFI